MKKIIFLLILLLVGCEKTPLPSSEIDISTLQFTSIKPIISGKKAIIEDSDCFFDSKKSNLVIHLKPGVNSNKLVNTTFSKVTSEIDYPIPYSVNRVSCFFILKVDYSNKEYELILPDNIRRTYTTLYQNILFPVFDSGILRRWIPHTASPLKNGNSVIKNGDFFKGEIITFIGI